MTDASAIPTSASGRTLLCRYLYGDQKIAARDVEVQGPIYSGYNSRIFRVVSSKLPYPCALKFCLKTQTLEPDCEGAARQFRTLEKVNNAILSDTACRVPRPQLLMEPDGALLTEWVCGVRVSKLLFSIRQNSVHAGSLIERSAMWLRRFHAAHALPSAHLDTDDKLENIARIRKQPESHDALFERAKAVLRSQDHRAASITLPASWLHGDFKSSNLMLSDSTTFGLDIHVRTEGIVIYDIAQFINDLDLNIEFWRTPYLSVNKHCLFDRFIEYYLHGSGIDAEQLRVPVLWVRLYMLLHGWNAGRTEIRRSFHGWFLQRQRQRALIRVSAELEQSLS